MRVLTVKNRIFKLDNIQFTAKNAGLLEQLAIYAPNLRLEGHYENGAKSNRNGKNGNGRVMVRLEDLILQWREIRKLNPEVT